MKDLSLVIEKQKIEFHSLIEKEKLTAAKNLHKEITTSVKEAVNVQETRHIAQIEDKKHEYAKL